jgi:hypothetical protein
MNAIQMRNWLKVCALHACGKTFECFREMEPGVANAIDKFPDLNSEDLLSMPQEYRMIFEDAYKEVGLPWPLTERRLGKC